MQNTQTPGPRPFPANAAFGPFGPFVEGLVRLATDEGNANYELPPVPHFEILSHVHDGHAEGGIAPKLRPHPITRKLTLVPKLDGEQCLPQEVPFRFLGKKPETVMRARFEAIDAESGRMLCSGDGAQAVRLDGGGLTAKSHACVGPEGCAFAQSQGISCRFRCRMDIQIEGGNDPLSVFQFQSGGINTYRTLLAKITMLHAIYGDLRGLPLRLTTWAKSCKLSGYEPFNCANIEIKEGVGMKEAGDAATLYREAFNMDGLEPVLETFMHDSAGFCVGRGFAVELHVESGSDEATKSRQGDVSPSAPTTSLAAVVQQALARSRSTDDVGAAQESAAERMAMECEVSNHGMFNHDDGRSKVLIQESIGGEFISI